MNRLGSRWKRLNSLYHIKDVEGKVVKFTPNWAQKEFYQVIWFRNVILKARQLGFSTFIILYILDHCLFNSNQKCGIIDSSLDDAKKKLDKIKFAYDKLPAFIKGVIKPVRWGAEEISFSNGSSIVVGTSHRGDTLQILHVSEFGKIAARFPEKAQEIKTGAFNAVHTDCQIFVESTAEGQQGEFFDLVQTARNKDASNIELSRMEFKFHFFPWWRNPSYKLDNCGNVSIPYETQQYFTKLEQAGIKLSPEQKAWYVLKAEEQGDLIKREFPALPEEAFEASLEGAYFTKQLETVRKNNGINPLPYEYSIPVHTFWDIADNSDYMAVWFFQHVGSEYRFLRYYQAAGEDYGHFKNMMNSFGYIYGKHYFPHDGGNTTQTPQGLMTKMQIANSFGIAPITKVQRTRDKQASIDKARIIMPRCKFCSVNASNGIKLLEAYRKEWNEKLGRWNDKPRHDDASHCADAFMTFTDGYEESDPQFKRHEYSTVAIKAETEYDYFN